VISVRGPVLALVAIACHTEPAGPCPGDMQLIVAGTTTVGFELPRREWMEVPRAVDLGRYCIDRYELPNKAGQVPLHDLSWDGAVAACAAVDKRLCTSAEWERACRGTQGWKFAYGPGRDGSRCNTPIDGAGPGSAPVPLKGSGAYPDCVSAEGVFDLNGSVSEWTADPWEGPPEPFNANAEVDGAWFTLRGGTMWNGTFYGQDCSSRHGHHRSFENMDDGARCCRDVAR
jgi:formylglycine-generating enzyme